jgi:hypothetical protein
MSIVASAQSLASRDWTERSQGMFRHPAIAASLCGLTLPLVLAYLIAARKRRDRMLFDALCLRFRCIIADVLAGRINRLAVRDHRLLCRRNGVTPHPPSRGGRDCCGTARGDRVSTPLLLVYFGVRLETFFVRFNMIEAGHLQEPRGFGDFVIR